VASARGLVLAAGSIPEQALALTGVLESLHRVRTVEDALTA
jgi:hypothetical protein